MCFGLHPCTPYHPCRVGTCHIRCRQVCAQHQHSSPSDPHQHACWKGPWGQLQTACPCKHKSTANVQPKQPTPVPKRVPLEIGRGQQRISFSTLHNRHHLAPAQQAHSPLSQRQPNKTCQPCMIWPQRASAAIKLAPPPKGVAPQLILGFMPVGCLPPPHATLLHAAT